MPAGAAAGERGRFPRNKMVRARARAYAWGGGGVARESRAPWGPFRLLYMVEGGQHTHEAWDPYRPQKDVGMYKFYDLELSDDGYRRYRYDDDSRQWPEPIQCRACGSEFYKHYGTSNDPFCGRCFNGLEHKVWKVTEGKDLTDELVETLSGKLDNYTYTVSDNVGGMANAVCCNHHGCKADGPCATPTHIKDEDGD